MSSNSFQRQGDPVEVGWSIGHAPLWLRGIRLVEGEGGSTPSGTGGENPQGGQSGGQAPQGGQQQPTGGAPTPAQVAAFYAAQNGGQAPQPQAPAQQAAPQPQTVQGFTPEQVQKLLEQNSELQKQFEQTQKERDEARGERDGFKGQIDEHTRARAITTAAGDKANAGLLLDSAKFQTAIKEVKLDDPAALTAAVEKFVAENPAYAAGPKLPGSSGAAPTGGTTTKQPTLQGAVAAHYGG